MTERASPSQFGVEVAHPRVGEDQSEEVAIPLWDLGEVDHQGRGKRVPGEDVMGGCHDYCRGVGDVVEDAAHMRLDLLRRAAALLRGVAPGKLEHVGALVVGQAEDARQGREHFY
jgi:hypothetical protein